MTKPSLKADLLLYIAATDSAVSAVLVEERKEADALKQFPVYYVSEALSGSKLFYSEMEKMTYAVVMAKGSFSIISRATMYQSLQLSLFGTCLRTRNPREEWASGPQNWRSTS
jgi:hypothetical protein